MDAFVLVLILGLEAFFTILGLAIGRQMLGGMSFFFAMMMGLLLFGAIVNSGSISYGTTTVTVTGYLYLAFLFPALFDMMGMIEVFRSKR